MTQPESVGPSGIPERSRGGVVRVRRVPGAGMAAGRLGPVLQDAEEDDDRVRAALSDPACTNYAAFIGDLLVGAAVVRWGTGEPSELRYLAVARDQRGKGYGKQLVAAIQAELLVRGGTLLVGTANSSLDNIAFYQRCGFRMHSVERDHFAYVHPPVNERGIAMRDMIVFSHEPDPGTDAIDPGPAGTAVPGHERRQPLFCDVTLGARIERVEAQLIAEAGAAARLRLGGGEGFVMPVAGGVACFAEQDSPLNKVAALGFARQPTAAELDHLEQAFVATGAPVQVEIASLADPAIGGLFTARGYRLGGFENVLGRAVHADARARRMAGGGAGIEVRPTQDDEDQLWLEVVADAVMHPDAQGIPSHEAFPRDVVVNAMRDMGAAGVRRYLALRDGRPAGGASMRVAEGVAQLTGAATLPAHRRRGVQAALLDARLADAAAAGCDVAVVTTQPGSTSQHNVQRQGFDLLYTRAVLTRQAFALR